MSPMYQVESAGALDPAEIAATHLPTLRPQYSNSMLKDSLESWGFIDAVRLQNTCRSFNGRMIAENNHEGTTLLRRSQQHRNMFQRLGYLRS
jgi:hypothetical protein